MKKLLLIAITAPIILTGCAAGFEESFSCTKVGGVSGCTSMSEIRENIDLYSNGQTPPFHSHGSGSPSVVSAENVPNNFVALPRRDKFGQPERTKEVKRKVTVFPFLTPDGSYVDTVDIYIIQDESHWTGRPVSGIRGD